MAMAMTMGASLMIRKKRADWVLVLLRSCFRQCPMNMWSMVMRTTRAILMCSQIL